MKVVSITAIACFLVITAGCENGAKSSPLAQKLETLRLEKKQLTQQVKQQESEARELKKQVQVLSGLDEDKLESLYSLQKIKLTRYTGLYDKDKDGKKEKLIVYIQPIDEEGDIVKATGTVDVWLWDLSKEGEQALLGKWHVGGKELKKEWFATLITINYRLVFDVSDKVENFEEPLTVKIDFTDSLSGKVFKEQKTIKP